jgi:hypothetical protein
VLAFSLEVGSFQHSSGGATGGGHWTNVLVFTSASAVVRLLACIIPILFAISLAFAGSFARHVARTVFLFFALLLALSATLCAAHSSRFEFNPACWKTGWRLDPYALRGSVNYDSDRCRHRTLALSRNPGID